MESLRAGASVISQNGPRGVGAAIKAGYREGLRRGGEVLVVLAGDMQHDPAEIPKLLKVMQDGHADYVTGNRLGNSPVTQGMPPFRYVGNVLLTFLTRLITRTDARDSQCGFTAIRRAAIEKVDIGWISDTWGITNGLLAECGRNRLRVKSVPVSTHYGARGSYIRLPAYIAWMIFILARVFFRISTKGRKE
jgi:glycosyltransferase involved in cell wall biosynthesis